MPPDPPLKPMATLDLFSGIGAFSLGLERTGGFRTVAFCEIDPFARRVLAKHWPEVPQYDDVRTLTADRLQADSIFPDVICGGFPCQDISVAGRGAGIGGERSGLWSEFARIIGEVGPRYIIVENVAALLGRGLGSVLGDLASLGYDAEWHCIPASAVGAPHIRDRVWIVAYSECAERWSQRGPCDGLAQREIGLSQREEGPGRFASDGSQMADAIGARLERCAIHAEHAADECEAAERSGAVSNTESNRRPTEREWTPPRYADGLRELLAGRRTSWEPEPAVGRLVDGPASRLYRRERLTALGNSLVPQIPELIGEAILRAEATDAP